MRTAPVVDARSGPTTPTTRGRDACRAGSSRDHGVAAVASIASAAILACITTGYRSATRRSSRSGPRRAELARAAARHVDVGVVRDRGERQQPRPAVLRPARDPDDALRIGRRRRRGRRRAREHAVRDRNRSRRTPPGRPGRRLGGVHDVAVLAWSMGSEVLLDPTQPAALLLPLLLLMMLAGASPARDFALCRGSSVSRASPQTYVTYVFIVGLLAVWASRAWCLRLRSAATPPTTCGGSRRIERDRGGRRRAVLATAAPTTVRRRRPGQHHAAVERGPPPLADARVRRGDAAHGRSVTVPPWWFRPSFHDFLANSRTPSRRSPVAIVTIGCCSPARAARALDASTRRRCRRDGRGHCGRRVRRRRFHRGPHPLGLFGASSHVYRWLWPLAAFVTFVFVIALVRYALTVVRPVVLVAIFAVVATLFAVWNIPTTDQGASASTDGDSCRARPREQLAELRGRGPARRRPALHAVRRPVFLGGARATAGPEHPVPRERRGDVVSDRLLSPVQRAQRRRRADDPRGGPGRRRAARQRASRLARRSHR